MGKREVGELSVFDVVVFVIMAEVAAFALNPPIQNFFIPFSDAYSSCHSTCSSYFSLKSKRFRDLLMVNRSVMIRHGQILEEEMRKQRYNLDDLFQQLREQQIGSVHEVSFAFLEPSGIFPFSNMKILNQYLLLFADGVIQIDI